MLSFALHAMLGTSWLLHVPAARSQVGAFIRPKLVSLNIYHLGVVTQA